MCCIELKELKSPCYPNLGSIIIQFFLMKQFRVVLLLGSNIHLLTSFDFLTDLLRRFCAKLIEIGK